MHRLAAVLVLLVATPSAQTPPPDEQVLTPLEQAPHIRSWIARRRDTAPAPHDSVRGGARPQVIRVNTSEAWTHADCLMASTDEPEAFRHVMRVAHQVIREAFFNHVKMPGVTTTDDVMWWMRQRVVGARPWRLALSISDDLATGWSSVGLGCGRAKPRRRRGRDGIDGGQTEIYLIK